MHAAGYQPRDMRDVSDQDRVDLARDLGEPIELDRPRDRSTTAEDQLGTLPASQRP